ncbi:LuxR C-terminal-related transcriptional regulator [Sphingomonas sanxanigenens]|uniref:HTH luxR-type domain-containing protein n=1 Tax=Sphingomonas sanxanigenens DSM 19645 = NX02 TaxID=1123269 RepID=W0A9Q2_9SPHN|nr:LuxR family transcriptional regulator [Sphingomonas sanxanigenens]AHE53207.1 hypothetical protein NX02_07405 [Sphingomonas sanxanigenens DSM 19645 = NX02]
MTALPRVMPLPATYDGSATAETGNRQSAAFREFDLFAPPAPLTADVRLERLARLIEPIGPQRVLQVYGPTGLGKTTLLANHASACRALQRQVRWLDLRSVHIQDEGAFRRVLSAALCAGDESHADFDRIRAAVRLDADPVLVIDANALDVGPLGRVLAELVHCTGPELQLWVVSRRPASAMLAELRSPHLVRTLDPAALLFDHDETGRNAAEGGAGHVGSAAEGWPLAEAIVAALPPEGAGADRLLDHDGGLLEAAIRDGIWRDLPAATRDLLAETAMVEWVDERYLSRVAAPLAAFPILDDIATLVPLVRVRRGTSGGFSIHPLLRAFALRQLERSEPAHRNRAYRQALLHHAERREPEAAIALVRDTGDQGLARMAFETFTSTELLRSSGYNRLRSAMAQLIPEAAEQSAQIRITQAVVAMKEGRFPEARRLLESARETLSEDLAYQSPSLSRVYADFIISQHTLAFHAHTELTESQLSEGAFWSTYTNDLTNAAFVYALRSLHYLRRGEIALAQDQIEISRDKYERATSYYGLGSALLVDGMIALAAGRLGRAETLATEARLLITRAMPDDAGLMAVAECVLCEVAFERGNADGLFERVDAALRDLEACDGWPDAFVIGYRVGARAAMATGSEQRALGLLNRAIRLMRGRGLSDIERYCRILRADVSAKSGGGMQGWRTGEIATNLLAPDWIGWCESDETELLDGHEALKAGDQGRLGNIVRRLEDVAAESGRRITAIRALLLSAVGAFARDHMSEAVQHLEKAVGLAEAEAIAQPFIEHGPKMLLILEAMKADPSRLRMGRGTRGFCAGLARTIAARSQDADGGAVFVPRELQVIRFLAQRQSNKAIARELGLSASAVKFHLSNIYRKLGVNKRHEAVIEAQRIGVSL